MRIFSDPQSPPDIIRAKLNEIRILVQARQKATQHNYAPGDGGRGANPYRK